MRVLLVAHGFPPTAMGGTEIYTHDLARALRSAFGDEVFVLAREADPSRPEYELRHERRDGVEVFLVNNTFRRCRSFAETYANPAIRGLVARVIDDVRPDVAHLQHLTCLSTELVVELEERRIPTLFTLNDYWLLCHRGQLLDLDLQRCDGPGAGCERCIGTAAAVGERGYRLAGAVRAVERHLPAPLARVVGRGARAVAGTFGRRARAAAEGERRARHMRWIAGQVDHLLAPSQTLRRRFLDFGLPADRISHVQQGIDQRPLAGIERVPADRLRIGFLGSMMASKAPHLLLEAFAGLPPGAATLEIYGSFAGYHGDDSYRLRVEPLLRQPGVRHHGAIGRSEVPRALANLDVLVVPSIWLENAPFVIREAFAAGVPVVASDLGGMAEMVDHGVNGLRFRPGDAADLRRTLRRLLDEPGLLERLRAGIPRQMTIEEDAAQLRELYLRHLQARPTPSHQRLAAVVLNFRTPQDTLLAVRSLQSSRRRPDHIVVVDNGSGDGSAELLRRRLEGVVVLDTGANLGFSGGTNVGIRRALADGAGAVFLMNGDVMLAADTLGRLERALASDPDVGLVAPVILHRADPSRIASAGLSFRRLSGRMRHVDADRAYDQVAPPASRHVAAVAGCAALVRREVLERVGLLDPDYFFTFEDLDLGLRASTHGFSSLTVGDAVAYHAGSLSIGPRSPLRLYYTTRNHLLVASRAAPLPFPLSAARAGVILLLNLAHAARCGWVPLPQAVAAVLRGARDHLRGRYGKAGPGGGATTGRSDECVR